VPASVDLTGAVFGKLTVRGRAATPEGVKRKRAYWDCVCSCDGSTVHSTTDLRSGKAAHCGCSAMDSLALDLTGQVFGKLTVQRLDSRSNGSRAGRKWLCLCECGDTRVVSAGHLRAGKTAGCLACSKKARYASVLAGRQDDMHAQDGMRFGSYTVIGPAKDGAGRPGRLCRCVCGTEQVVPLGNLLHGRQLSCSANCLGRRKSLFAWRKARREETGKRYGILTIRRIFKGKDGKPWAHCGCDCGTQGFKAALVCLKSGNTKGCGCLQHVVPESRRGDNHPGYKPELTDEERVSRRVFEGQDVFRSSIFKRDDYTCVACGERGGKLEAHHIKPWSAFPGLRYQKRNLVTLCVKCHGDFHDTHSRQDPLMWQQFVPRIRERRKETGFVKH